MAMKPDDVKALATALEGKKSRVKNLKETPSETEEKKLPAPVKKGLEDHFGVRLSKVRVHVGGNAKEVCKSLKSQAFTIGHNLYLRKPSDVKNLELLAHELTHVLQFGKGKVPKPREGKALISM